MVNNASANVVFQLIAGQQLGSYTPFPVSGTYNGHTYILRGDEPYANVINSATVTEDGIVTNYVGSADCSAYYSSYGNTNNSFVNGGANSAILGDSCSSGESTYAYAVFSIFSTSFDIHFDKHIYVNNNTANITATLDSPNYALHQYKMEVVTPDNRLYDAYYITSGTSHTMSDELNQVGTWNAYLYECDVNGNGCYIQLPKDNDSALVIPSTQSSLLWSKPNYIVGEIESFTSYIAGDTGKVYSWELNMTTNDGNKWGWYIPNDNGGASFQLNSFFKNTLKTNPFTYYLNVGATGTLNVTVFQANYVYGSCDGTTYSGCNWINAASSIANVSAMVSITPTATATGTATPTPTVTITVNPNPSATVTATAQPTITINPPNISQGNGSLPINGSNGNGTLYNDSGIGSTINNITIYSSNATGQLNTSVSNMSNYISGYDYTANKNFLLDLMPHVFNIFPVEIWRFIILFVATCIGFALIGR